MSKGSKKTIGKRIAQLKVKIISAKPGDKSVIASEISRLENLKMPGSILYIKDSTFFDKPHKGGHLYLVDEHNGQRVAVNRISHYYKATDKKIMKSLPKNSKGTPAFIQLKVIYTGKKGKPIKLMQQREPLSGIIKANPGEIHEVRKRVERDPVQRRKWLNK